MQHAAADAPTPAVRILLVTEQVRSGGKRSHVDALRAGLDAIGWPAAVFDWNDVPVLERAGIAGPARILNALQPALGHRWSLPTLNGAFARGVASRLSPATALVHAQEPITFAGVRRAAGRLPVALTVHGPVHREVASAYGLALEHPTIRWIRGIEERAYREASAVIAVDRAHGDYVRGFGRYERVWVIPNFVDTRRFYPAVTAPELPGPLAAWIAGRPLLLCPRRLVPKNGVDVAVRAAARLRASGVACALVITGEGPRRPELERLIAELGVPDSVLLCGDVPAELMPAWCARAAVVVVPSVPSLGVEEATSISVLEAQACARPVVASALGGILEIVADGKSGLLFPPGDDTALAAAITRVLADPLLARALGEGASAEVFEHHSHVAGARAYAAVYEELGVRAPDAH
jgi:glycosyltransferase involved in cell wall biosynthesis